MRYNAAEALSQAGELERASEAFLRAEATTGAEDRHGAFVDQHPSAEQLGARAGGRLPWTLISDLDPAIEDDICFNTEAFCGVFGEVGLEAMSVPEYIEKAVEFCNERMWGTLNSAILVLIVLASKLLADKRELSRFVASVTLVGVPLAGTINAARALIDTEMSAEEIARKAMAVAAEICVFTNDQLVIESLEAE